MVKDRDGTDIIKVKENIYKKMANWKEKGHIPYIPPHHPYDEYDFLRILSDIRSEGKKHKK